MEKQWERDNLEVLLSGSCGKKNSTMQGGRKCEMVVFSGWRWGERGL